MSSVLYRAHSFYFARDSLVLPIVNVFFQTVDEFVHCLKFFAVEHFNFQPSQKVFHRSVVHTVSFPGQTLNYIVFFLISLVFIMLVLPALIRVKDWRCIFGQLLCKSLQHFSYLRKIRTERNGISSNLSVV